MSEKTTGSSGVGINIDVVLSPRLEKATLETKMNSTLTSSIDKAISNLASKNQAINNDVAGPIRSLVSAISANSRSVRKDPVAKSLVNDINRLNKQLATQGKAKSRTEYNKSEVEISNTIASMATMFETLMPKLTHGSKSMSKQVQSKEAQRLYKLLAQSIKARNSGVTQFESTFGESPKNAAPDLLGRRVNVEISSIKTYHSRVERENARHINVLQQQNRKIRGLETSLPMHGGMALDTETANFSKNSLWAVSSRTAGASLGTMQRNLPPGSITRFHSGYAKNMQAGAGTDLNTIVNSIYNQYAATNKAGNLKGQLTPFIGHNNQFDIDKIHSAASSVNTPQGKELASAMKRLMPGGDSYALAKQGDTARIFNDFLRNKMNFTDMPGVKAPGGMGGTLGAASAAFGYKLKAHDPASDTAASEFIYRLVNNEPDQAKKMFNKKAWLAQARKDTYAQELNRAVGENYGEENLHLVNEAALPANLQGGVPLSALRGQAQAKADIRYQNLLGNLGVSSSVTTATPKAASQAQRSMYDIQAKKAMDLILNSVGRSSKGLEGKELEHSVASVLDHPDVDKALKFTVGATGNTDKGLKDILKSRISDAYGLMGHEAAPESLKGVFSGLYEDKAKAPKVGPKTQYMEKGLLRISSLAQVFNDWGGKGGFKTLDSLENQYKFGATVPAPPSEATERGNIFEKKAMADLAKNKDLKLTKTLEDQLTLSLGTGITGHPDGFMYNKKTGVASLAEAKYRSKADQTTMDRGEIPAAYRAQASAYALASGLPNLPTTFVTGNLEAGNKRTDEIDTQLAQGLTGTKRGALEKERAGIVSKMPKEDYRLKDLYTRTVMPDKKMMARIKEAIPAITGKEFDPKLISGLPEDVLTSLGGGKQMSTEELNVAIKKATTSLARVANANDKLTISTENLGKGEERITASQGSKIKSWNPYVGSTKEEQLQSGEKLYESSRKRLRELGVKELGYKEYIAGKKSTGLESDANLAKIAQEELGNVQKDKTLERVRAQGLRAGLDRMQFASSTNKPKDRVEGQTAEFRTQLAMEKQQLVLERENVAVRLRTDGGKYATTQDAQRAAELNSILATRHGVKGSSGAVDDSELSAIVKKQGLEKTGSPAAGGGGKGRGGKDFVGGAIDLLDWQIQWMAGVTVLNAISGAFKNSIGFAVEFEAALKNIQLITQASTVEMDALTGNLEGLTSTFQYSATELGQGLIVLGQAGFDATESLQILPAVTALATATLSDLKTATDITTTAIKAFNVPVEETGRIVNVLASMTIESKLDIEKLGTSFNYIASTASAAGFSLEETGTAMGLMSNAGVRASTIGTTLRSVIGSLLHPTKKFEDALASAGLAAEDVSPSYNSLGDIFRKLKSSGFDVEDAFAGLDKRIAGGAITLVQAADQFDGFEASITGTNRAFDMATKQMDTFQAQTKRMGHIGQLIGAEVFTSSLGPLKDVAAFINEILEGLLAIGKAVPDTFKTLGTSISALTVGGSLAIGVGRGVWDTGSNVRAALKKEDETRLPGAKRGESLKGRNKQVYSMYSTFFSPQVLAASVATAVAVLALSRAYENLSGHAKMLQDIKVKDQFIADNSILEKSIKLYEAAIGNTRKLTEARKALAAQGVTDITPVGLADASSKSKANVKEATAESFRSRIKYNKGIFSSRTTDVEDAAIAKDFLVSQDLYWSGSDKEKELALNKVGLNRSTGVKSSMWTQQQIDAQNPKYIRFQQAEAKRRLMQAASEKARLERQIAAIDGDGVPTEIPGMFDKKSTVHSTFGTEQPTKREKLQYESRKANLELEKAGRAYTSVKDQSTTDLYMSGNERTSKEDRKILLGRIANAKEVIAANDAGWQTRSSGLASDLAVKELNDLENSLRVVNKKYAVKKSMKGQPRSFEKLTHQYFNFLGGGGDFDETAAKQFKNISAGNLSATGGALLKLNTSQNTERVKIKEYFGGQVPIDVEAALNIKYKVQAQDIIQAESDKAFAPMEKLYSSLSKQIQDKSSFLTAGLKSSYSSMTSTIGSTAYEANMKGLQSQFTFGRHGREQQSFGGYDSAKVGFEEERAKLAAKRASDEKIAEEAKAANKLIYENKKKAFVAQMGSEENLTKAQKTRLKQIELDYSKTVIALSRDRRKAIEDDLAAVQALAVKQQSNINSWKTDKASVTQPLNSLVQDANEKLNPKSREEKMRGTFRSASNNEWAAEQALKTGDRTGAKAAAAAATNDLKWVIDNGSKADVSKAKRMASGFEYDLGKGYDSNINQAEVSLADTNSILENILKALTSTEELPDVVKTEDELTGVTEARLTEYELMQVKIGDAMMKGGEGFADSFLTAFKSALPSITEAIRAGIVAGTASPEEGPNPGIKADEAGKNSTKASDAGNSSAKVEISLKSDILQATITDQIVTDLTRQA